MLQTVILAGGLATRLWPETKTIPKSLIDILDKPFIDWQLSLLKENGIKDVLMCVGFLGEQIEAYVGNGEKWGLAVQYSYDGDVLKGTGGALKNAEDKLHDKFFLMYGDSYLTTNFQDIEKEFLNSDKQTLMTVYKNEGKYDSSNVSIKNNTVVKYDKNAKDDEDIIYIDYGLLILSKDFVIQNINNEVVDLSVALKKLVNERTLHAYEVQERFYEIGSKHGIKELVDYLQKNHKELITKYEK